MPGEWPKEDFTTSVYATRAPGEEEDLTTKIDVPWYQKVTFELLDKDYNKRNKRRAAEVKKETDQERHEHTLKTMCTALADRANNISNYLRDTLEQKAEAEKMAQSWAEEAERWKAAFAEVTLDLKAKDKGKQKEESKSVRGSAAYNTVEKDAAGCEASEIPPRYKEVRDPQAKQLRHRQKIENPPTFMGSHNPTFENWEHAVKRKLNGDSIYFDDENHKINYLLGFIGGDAQEFIKPYLEPESVNHITVAMSIVEVMRGAYGKTRGQKRSEARANFKKLRQGDDSFSAFFTKFLTFASQLQLRDEDRMDELREKMSPKLQNVIAGLDFESTLEMSQHCLKIEPHLQLARKSEDQAARYQQRKDRYKKPLLPPEHTRTAPPRASGPPKPKVLARNAGVCFHCHKTGHYANACPTAKVNEVDAKKKEEAEASGSEFTMSSDEGKDCL